MDQTQTIATKTLGLLAGSGDLPRCIIQHCMHHNIPIVVIAFHGQTAPELVHDTPHIWTHLGSVRASLTFLKAHGVTQLVLAGAIRRPSWSELKLDWMGLWWAKKIGIKALGDDGLLRNLLALINAQGFEIISPKDFLSNLFAPKGILTTRTPDDQDMRDIQRGIQALQVMGPVDIGQAVVVQQGIVLAIEAIEGSAAMIQRSGTLKRQGPGGVLVKIAKKQQTSLVDLPTIGPDTIESVYQAGLQGIAIGADTTQIIHKEQVIRLANQYRLFIISVPV